MPLIFFERDNIDNEINHKPTPNSIPHEIFEKDCMDDDDINIQPQTQQQPPLHSLPPISNISIPQYNYSMPISLFQQQQQQYQERIPYTTKINIPSMLPKNNTNKRKTGNENKTHKKRKTKNDNNNNNNNSPKQTSEIKLPQINNISEFPQSIFSSQSLFNSNSLQSSPLTNLSTSNLTFNNTLSNIKYPNLTNDSNPFNDSNITLQSNESQLDSSQSFSFDPFFKNVLGHSRDVSPLNISSSSIISPILNLPNDSTQLKNNSNIDTTEHTYEDTVILNHAQIYGENKWESLSKKLNKSINEIKERYNILSKA